MTLMTSTGFLEHPMRGRTKEVGWIHDDLTTTFYIRGPENKGLPLSVSLLEGPRLTYSKNDKNDVDVDYR